MEPQEREKEVTNKKLGDTIVVVLEGGLVSAVIADPQSEVVVVDYDVEGIDEAEHDMIKVGGSEATVSWRSVTPAAEAFPGLTKALKKMMVDRRKGKPRD